MPDDSRKSNVLKLASQYHGLALVEEKLSSEQQERINKFLDTNAPLLVITRPEGKKSIFIENEVNASANIN
jgi:hypothetical protein